MRIGIVAGELSGDLLGAGLIRAIRTRYPSALIEGIGGPQMMAAGFHSHYPLEILSVMGLVEVIKHYRRIKHCHDHLAGYFLQHPPQVFIGIDAPDFNLSLEQILKQQGIPTVHYVSPSVWAWRHYRLRKIARACDLMLTLFPFEASYYQQHHLPVKFVGHPLADEIPLYVDKKTARQSLNLSPDETWIALLPGSRYFEVNLLGPIFLQTAQWLLTYNPHLRFVTPMANETLFKLFTQQMTKLAPTMPLTLLNGQSRSAMAAADVILTASGTATLEAMLLKRPMVVAYRLATLTYWLAKRLVHTPYFALPNLLAQEKRVPEFLQDQVTAEQLGTAVLHWLEHPQQVAVLQTQFTHYHQQLRHNASEQAAQAIFNLIL
ncbi:MAG: lipid-A-disaccharide synthase [Beggiatoa sp. IS2]|nr:MAG: lipid-A-disaccharide synthase [Beggiatoa sp. IS2]